MRPNSHKFRHKERTKIHHQLIDCIRIVAYGFEPLYALEHKSAEEQPEEKKEAQAKRYEQEKQDRSGSNNRTDHNFIDALADQEEDIEYEWKEDYDTD